MKKSQLIIYCLLTLFACNKPDTTTKVQVVVPAITSFSPTQGSPGTVITISGTNLDVTKSVTINGSAAFYKIENSSNLEAVIPSTAKTGLVGIGYSGGTISSTGTLTVLPPADTTSPVITNVLPDNNPTGGPVLILGTNIDSVASVSFNGVSAHIDTNFVDANSVGTLTTTVPGGITPGLCELTITRKNGTFTKVPFTIVDILPFDTETQPDRVVIKKLAPYIVRVPNDWFNEYGSNGDNVNIETPYPGPFNLGGVETINDVDYGFYVSALDTVKKTIELTINRGTNPVGDSINVKYEGRFVEAKDATHQRIIFFNDQGRQIVVNTSL